MLLPLKDKAGKTDAELLDLYRRSGRSEHFGQLYDRYIPLVYGLCLKYLKSVERAEDAVMQLFEILSNKVGRYEIREFRTWVYSVAKNHCLQQLRAEGREIPTDFSTVVVESDGMDDLLNKQQDEIRFSALEKCLEKLPEPQKLSVRLFYLDERSYVEVAEQTGYQLKSVKSYIQNGKRNLKICLEKEGASA
jgi:RNA polymerase sigma-70 factor (ECF subfamily)